MAVLRAEQMILLVEIATALVDYIRQELKIITIVEHTIYLGADGLWILAIELYGAGLY